MNEATFTCSASSKHENIIHEVTKYCMLNHECFVPPKITRYSVLRSGKIY